MRSYESSWRARAPASPPAPRAAGYGDPSPTAPRLQPRAPRHRSPPPPRAPHPRIRRSRVMSPYQLNGYQFRLVTAVSRHRLKKVKMLVTGAQPHGNVLMTRCPPPDMQDAIRAPIFGRPGSAVIDGRPTKAKGEGNLRTGKTYF